MALAVAACLEPETPPIAIVPAGLVVQWRSVARASGVPLNIHSQDAVSRGRLPQTGSPFVIIDESHRFRNPATKRYTTLAPWLVGRRGILLSGTPIVNRRADLGHQLRLFVPDSALASLGVASLSNLPGADAHHQALANIVITDIVSGRGLPHTRERTLAATPRESQPIDALLCTLDRLVLAPSPEVSALIRTTLWRALASSPSALGDSLRRYRRLLLHSRDGAAQGRGIGRADIRAFLGPDLDQLVWWEFWPEQVETDLVLSDLPSLDTAISEVDAWGQAGDWKARHLEPLLGDETRTLIFTTARSTVEELRQLLSRRSPAWCTGDRAGIGITTLPRDAILRWFRPGAPLAGRGPRVLITTDLAAEGLDLQLAGRVIHYDLPWTATRVEQRNGRAVRLGAISDQVEIIRFEPPVNLERRLRQVAALVRKAQLPTGIGLTGDRGWNWRVLAGTRGDRPPGTPGLAVVDTGAVAALTGGALVGLDLGASPRETTTAVFFIHRTGVWSDEREVIEAALDSATRSDSAQSVESLDLDAARRLLAPAIREICQAATGARWFPFRLGPASLALITKLQRLGRGATRDRDQIRADLIERAIHFANRGHTSGEEALIHQLASLEDAPLLARLEQLPGRNEEVAAATPQVRGLILFRCGGMADPRASVPGQGG